MNDFVYPDMKSCGIARYSIRQFIFKAIQKAAPQFSGRLLDIGCGKMPYKEFILQNSTVESYLGLDIEHAIEYDKQVKPDYYWNGTDFPDHLSAFESILLTEVLEHCPDPFKLSKQIYNALETNGLLFGTVPFIWNLHEAPHDHYRYTPYALKNIFENAGFSKVTIAQYGGWYASLAQFLGIFIERSPLPNPLKKVITPFLRICINKLLKADSWRFGESDESKLSSISPGYFFICRK